jgi:glycerol-3-phosphate dehydrogenase
MGAVMRPSASPFTFESREANRARLESAPLDVLILGGGINGAGIARDLALRSEAAGAGLGIGLLERRHFACGASSRNSHLVHGGLRYLKYLELHLVREALRERATLLGMAPGLVVPQPFLIPFYGAFASLFYGAGLALYDALAGKRRVGRRERFSRESVRAIEPAIESAGLAGGAVFFDARMQAARLVLENVFDAARRGAIARNYSQAAARKREAGLWRVEVRDTLNGETFTVRARKLVDTTGPWQGSGLRLVRGSHLVFPRLTESPHAIAHFEPSGRILFVVPFGEGAEWSLVGTTDVDHCGGPDRVRISHDEASYLHRAVSRVLPGAARVRPVAAFSALRPLIGRNSGSATAVSREHRIWNDAEGVLHVAGGKYTTYRAMSEQAADLLARELAPPLESLRPTRSTPFVVTERTGTPAGFAMESEMARRLSDVLLISTSAGYQGDTRARGEALGEMSDRLGWDADRRREELEELEWLAGTPASM